MAERLARRQHQIAGGFSCFLLYGGINVKDTRFSRISESILSELPKWFKMRRDKKSNGARFMNITGLQLEDVEYYLQYALDNQFISTADEQQVDIIYKGHLPASMKGTERLRFSGGNQRLEKVESLRDFYEGITTVRLGHEELYYINPYFIDWEKKIVYVKKKYNESDVYPEGNIHMEIIDEKHKKLFEMDIKTHLHHVWNFFDEFGLLLDTPRFYGENNREYKKRILDVFRNPASSTKVGLENSIARELGLWKEYIWHDGAVDFVIKESNVILRTITVDDDPVGLYDIGEDRSGRRTISGNDNFKGRMRRVKYVSGVDMHSFNDLDDFAFQDTLYRIDRVAKPMLKYYVDIITNQIPIMWNQFIWNESFWDIADEEMGGRGHIPNFNDARFLNWQKYQG